MKKFDFSQMIQIIANAGVIAGIAFLAIEINQNNQLLETQTSLILVENRTGFRDAIWSDRELAELAYKNRNGELLDPVDQLRIDMLDERVLIEIEWQYQQWAAGALPDIPIDYWRQSFRTDSGMHEAFDRIKSTFSDEFIDLVEADFLSD